MGSKLTNRAQLTILNLSSLGEDFTNPTDSIQPILQKLSVIKFPNNKARGDWLARIKEKFGEDVADLVDQYAGKPVTNVPNQITPALKSLIDNVNGIIAGNPGF